MSLLPLRVVDTLRDTMNVVIDVCGFPCELYVPKRESVEQREKADIYMEKPAVAAEKPIKTKVFIEWKPDMSRLRRLGIHTEDKLPIIAWFKSINELTRNAWIKVDINYAKNEWNTDEFELTDCLIRNMYNAIVVQAWVIAPRRK